MTPASHAFTVSAQTVLRVVETEASIGPAFNSSNPPRPMPKMCRFRAVWDTGATGTVITQEVADQCGLKAMGLQNVYTANGLCRVETFLISIFLPNNVGFSNIKVTKGNLGTTQVLIGMDIISQGDFALTHFQNKTTFSFRYPSMTTIDFAAEERARTK